MLHWTYFQFSNIFSHFSNILLQKTASDCNNNIAFYFEFTLNTIHIFHIVSLAPKKETTKKKDFRKITREK